MYLIFALVAFSILIIIHELGHFTLAKLNGVCVEEFAIGMGPKLFGFKGKETEYNLRVLPFGGFVRMLGEEGGAIKDNRAFNAKTPLQKISIIVAGATMNYVLALLIFGLIERNGEKIIKEIVPTIDETGNSVIGITHEFVKNPTIGESIVQGFKDTITMVSQTFKSLKMMFTGEANFKTDVGGPITIVKMSSQAAKAGIWTLMEFTAFMSVQLAVFNLLPLPALDGGLILIQILELITRKKIPEKFVGVVNSVGFALLMLLMVVVTLKDIIFPVL